MTGIGRGLPPRLLLFLLLLLPWLLAEAMLQCVRLDGQRIALDLQPGWLAP